MKRHHARFRGQRGQIFALVAITIPVLLGLGGLAIDVGHWYQVSRKGQAAADAAALSAARWLPNDPSGMTAAAQTSVLTTMAEANQPPDIIGPFCASNNPDPSNCAAHPVDVQVTVHASGSTFLTGIFGFNSFSITKTAVATRTEKWADAALFVGAVGNCNKNGIKMEASNVTINGAVISNGDFSVQGSGNTAAAASFYDGCDATEDTSNFSPVPAGDPVVQPWPLVFSRSDFSCTQSAASFDFSSSKPAQGWPSYFDGHTISPGTYCATGMIKISANDVVANNVTLIADRLQMNGTGSTFTPNELGVIFYADGSGNAMVSPSSINSWGGIIYVPNGTAVLPGSSNEVFNGFVEVLNLQLPASGSGFTINGTGPKVAVGRVKLIQ